MLCSMCPSITFSDTRAPGKGWQCPCGTVHCAHTLRCEHCQASRYWLEKAGKLSKGRPTK